MFRLLVEAWSNAVRQVTVSGWTRDDKAIDEFTLTTTADRAKNTVTKDIPGWPDFLEVGTRSVGVRRGELYVRVSLYVGGTKVRLLTCGYITDGRPLTIGILEGFTDGPGLIRSIAGTNPAAGAEISEAVPTNARWVLKAFYASLVTDATVVTRSLRIAISDGVSTLFVVSSIKDQVASETAVYSAAQKFEARVGTTLTNYVSHILPDFTMFQAYTVATAVQNLQAGDDWGVPRLLVEEWIEE